VAKSLKISNSLTSRALEDQVLAAWWNAYLPRRGADILSFRIPDICRRKLWSAEWAESVSDLSKESPILSKALCALALSSQGSLEQDEAIAHEGVKLYGQAVVQLNRILQSPERAANEDAVLPSCLLLSHYEVSLSRRFLF
jgi:hypothetical protein